ncbi:uncharacterized protein EC-HemY [Halorhodospira halochloris]|uniref:Uncharacterized protein EC-HemY n=1 Tax=Halorhodospira halochloris TaxID=1052 RepID=A0A120MZ73_HALHR|nr:heme biosynthesis HemY N-terminal domain-containing protein [Halorhodospira halochloris]MBK1650975.1 hypothetical protein [Halorhodospira halochloris]BAU56516.1 uncharacterized protein EC-HemY [Halorhodospira halochloris]
MRRLFIYLLILAGAVIAALYFNQLDGYAHFVVGEWRIEMSLLLTALLIALTVLVLYSVMIGTRRLLAIPAQLRNWQGRKRQESARTELTGGLLRFAEGDYDGAEQQLARSAKRSEAPLVNYLTAAIAAHRRGAREARDEYLNTAEQSGLGSYTAVQLLQAQLQIEAGELEEAQATVANVLDTNPKHRRALELMVTCSRALGDWERVEPLLSRIERYGFLPKSELEEINRWVAREKLSRASTVGRDALERTWNEFSRALRRDPEVIGAYADGLAMNGQVRAAEELIRRQLQKNWDEGLLLRYARLPAEAHIGERLAQVEAWLETRRDDPQVLFVAGALAIRAEQYDKAREYLEAAVNLSAQPKYLRALAYVQEQSGHLESARQTYREAMAITSDGDDLPEVLGLPEPASSDSMEYMTASDDSSSDGEQESSREGDSLLGKPKEPGSALRSYLRKE